MAPDPLGVHRSWGSAATAGRQIAVVVLLLLLIPIPAWADGGGDVEPTYSESNGCGVPRLFSALARSQGGLANSEPLRGPFGAMFGRTIGQAREATVPWTVPFSGGATIRVHSRALAAFQKAAENLAASGNSYATRPGELFGYAARTVSGTRSISYHAFGAAIDINSRTNPLASTLITDFPEWYVTPGVPPASAGAGTGSPKRKMQCISPGWVLRPRPDMETCQPLIHRSPPPPVSLKA